MGTARNARVRSEGWIFWTWKAPSRNAFGICMRMHLASGICICMRMHLAFGVCMRMHLESDICMRMHLESACACRCKMHEC